ncbi:MAG: ribbon-helix-helix protein, CopG family [Bifidobacteriaceae bacterium]|jgi:Arc/MetJ-type ribon-helix-helix transcriptional regulator|nr:ribbon-helix-helix protein, CopG family [Bifidobacteriaceae bacterium]
MKLSISLPARDVETIDRYAAAEGLPSRSAAVQAAVAQLRELGLKEDYKASFREWAADQSNQAWDAVAADGLADEAW